MTQSHIHGSIIYCTIYIDNILSIDMEQYITVNYFVLGNTHLHTKFISILLFHLSSFHLISFLDITFLKLWIMNLSISFFWESSKYILSLAFHILFTVTKYHMIIKNKIKQLSLLLSVTIIDKDSIPVRYTYWTF